MLEHLPDLEEDIKCFKDPIVLGDLNVDLKKTRILWSQRVADLLAEYSLIDMVLHFLHRRRFRNLKTWSQVWKRTVLQLRCDYILGADRRCFKLVGI